MNKEDKTIQQAKKIIASLNSNTVLNREMHTLYDHLTLILMGEEEWIVDELALKLEVFLVEFILTHSEVIEEIKKHKDIDQYI